METRLERHIWVSRMEPTNENDELKNILDSLSDGKDPLPAAAPIDITKIQPPLVQEEEQAQTPPPAPPPAPPVVAVPAEVMSQEQIDAMKLMRQYISVYDKFLKNYDTDREQIEKTISHLEDIVFNVGGAQRVHIEMLVAALRTKAETNGNIVKALDSVAKILAATKGTQVLIQNNNNNNAQKDLAEILKAPLYPDEHR